MQTMATNPTRRRFLRAMSAGALGLAAPHALSALEPGASRRTHLLTLSFDDGFRRSSIITAQIFEAHKLSACINVIASGHLKDFATPDEYQAGIPKGDFQLWNQLQARGHEIMPHGYKHANKRQIPLAEAQDLIRRCLAMFSRELNGFDPRKAVFNFPYNASTPELDDWLRDLVMARRAAGGSPINPWPRASQFKLATRGAGGPANCEKKLDQEIASFLAGPSGWLIYNLHGLDAEGWAPIRAEYLDELLKRLTRIETLEILPAARALLNYSGNNQSPASKAAGN